MTGGKLLSVKEAARYLGMSAAWLYSSGIPCVKLGRRRLYRTEDLDGYVARKVRR
jgi:excisionase family DNA binding protein